ncbi:MAG: single-stranded-DNA-specific exonuclease RecJ, partial [Hyphomicrobiales bacterium]|nr:single-stranded-DNA-specific exonuclease RecJ [Hyphomicrobiales bacterium]
LARDAGRGAGAFVVVSDEGWHPGIVGLVASRLKDKLGRPTFALALRGDGAVGSGRSIAGFDIGSAVGAALRAGVATKGGGHAMAAGVTLPAGGLEAFRDFLETRFGAAARALEGVTTLAIDATLTAAGANLERFAEIEAAGPFGQGAPEPIFAFAGHRVLDAAPVGEEHVRARIGAGDGASLDAIAFRARGTPLGEALLSARGGGPIHVAGSLSINRWRGAQKMQLRVADAAKAG